MVPWFQYCTDLWFTGYDPPKSLVPAAALAPPVTTSDPATPILSPQPSATQDPGARKTAAVWNPFPLPSPHQNLPLPKETNTVAKPKPETPKDTNEVPVVKPQVSQPNPSDGDPGTKHQDSPQHGSVSNGPSGQSNSNSGDQDSPGDSGGQTNLQSGNGDVSSSPGDSSQETPKDPNSPGQVQGASPAQVSTDPVTKHDLQNQNPYKVALNSPPVTTPVETTMSLAGHAVVAGPSGVHVDGIAVSPNQGPTTVSGAAILNQGNSIVVASHIFHLPASTGAVVTTIAGKAVMPIANGVSIQGTSVTGTSRALISGTVVSVGKSRLYIGSNSYPLPTADLASTTTLANGSVAIPLSNAVSIYGSTLTAGAPTATISGVIVSLDSAANLIFGGTAHALPFGPQTAFLPNQVATINSVAVKLLPSGVSVAGTTLTPGAPVITASGTPVSLGSTILAIGTSSVPVSFGNPQTLITTIGTQVVTAAATAVKFGSTTMLPGDQGTTLGGTLVSLGSDGTLVVGSKTEVLAGPSGSLGGVIMGGFGSGGSVTTNSSPTGGVQVNSGNGTNFGFQTFEGRAGRVRSLNFEIFMGFAVAVHIIWFLYI